MFWFDRFDCFDVICVFFVAIPIISPCHFNNKINYNDYMLVNLSPEKENRSPSPKKQNNSRKIIGKDNKTINQLLELLKKQGITIPPHIYQESIQQSPEKIIKLTQAKQNQMAKLRAELADKSFQVKKLEEDFAQYKLLTRFEQQKVLRKLREDYESQKYKHGEQIKKWEKKFTQMALQHQRGNAKFKMQTREYFQTQKQEQINLLKKNHSVKIQQLLNKEQAQRQEFLEVKQQIIRQFENKIVAIQMKHAHELQQIKKQYTQQIKKTSEIFQTKVMAIQCEKRAEVLQVEQSKKQTAKNQEKYLTQIGILERERSKISDQLDQMEMNCKVWQKKYESLKFQLQSAKKKHQDQIKEAIAEIEKIKFESNQSIEEERLKVLKSEYEKTEKMQIRFQKLEQLHQNLVHYHKINQKTLQNKFQRRQSKKEDIQFIKTIEQQLAFKEKEANKLYEHLKIVQLQKQNNDKIYTKIFTACRKERRNSTNREERDIYSLLKQSHTTDFRHLLKITHKDPK